MSSENKIRSATLDQVWFDDLEDLMKFTDDDLKPLKEVLFSDPFTPPAPISFDWEKMRALITRLEKSETLLDRGLAQMKLINGSTERCVIKDPKQCANHQWILEVEAHRNDR